MAYPEMFDWQLGTGLTASSAGAARKFSSIHPYIIRGFGIQPTSTKVKVTKPVFALRLATAGVTTVTGLEKGTITLPSGVSRVARQRLVTPFKVGPKTEAAVVVKTACTVAYPVRAVLYVEPSWDEPASLGTGVVQTVTA
jgi:hypothetical protein